MGTDVLLTLYTLKAQPRDVIVETITHLADRLQSLADEIVRLLPVGVENSIIRLAVDAEPLRIVQLGLVAVLAADTLTTPVHADYGQLLDDVRTDLNISQADLMTMLEHVDSLEVLIAAHPTKEEGGRISRPPG